MKTYRLQISLMCDGYTTKDFHEAEFSSMEDAEKFAKRNGLIIGGESSGSFAVHDGLFYNAEEVEEHRSYLMQHNSNFEFDCTYTHLEIISKEKDVDKLVEACQELLLSIGENTIDLWDANLNDTHSSILWDGGEVTTDYDKGEKTEFEGISEAHAKLYNLLKEMGVK